jgi:hypothetical protein
MKITNYLILLIVLFSLSSCQDINSNESTKKTTKNITSDLQLDHLNIWVKNPEKAKQRLTDIGFTAVPDSLSAIHRGQGTAGRYFHFLNNYLELIFVNDQDELEENNAKNEALDFTKRVNYDQNNASPFSIALKVTDYDVEKIPFEKVKYHQEWMEPNASIYAAKNSKTNLSEPSVFVVYPKLESDTYKTIADLQNIPDDYAFARDFYKHANGAQKLTNIIITSIDLDVTTKTMKAINSIEDIIVKKGKDHLMELYFDNNSQGKSFDLRPDLPLIIYL